MWKISAVVSALIVTALLAEPPYAQTSDPNNDPNQVVCVKEKETGSRVSSKRVCRTRAEWDQYRQQTRQVIERVQANKPTCEPAGVCG